MPCAAPARGVTDAKFPWYDPIQSNPCGLPIVSAVAGVDVSAENLCLFHYEMKYGQAAVPVPAKADPATVLLLHADSLSDEKGHPLTVTQSAQVSTAQSKFGGSSFLFDGGGDSIETPDSQDWDLGAGDFTLECWVRATAFNNPNTSPLISSRGDVGNAGWRFELSPTGQIRFLASYDGTNYTVGINGPVLNLGQWYHAAAVRSGGTITIYQDGVAVASQVNTGTFFNSTAPLRIGMDHFSYNCMNGHIDEVRISKVARWAGPFTPPTAPYA